MKMRKGWLWLLTALVIPVGYIGTAIAGNLEPSGAPGSTMRTLEDVDNYGVKTQHEPVKVRVKK